MSKQYESQRPITPAMQADILDLLAPLSPDAAMVALAETLIEKAGAGESVVTDAVQSISDWLDSESPAPIREETLAVYERVRRRTRAAPVIEGVPAELQPLVVVLYLRARTALQNPGTPRLFRDLSTHLGKVRSSLQNFGGGFLGELLVETELKATRDPVFSAALAAGTRSILSLAPQLEALEEQGQTLYRKPSGCSCVVRACNNQGDCRYFCIGSWWTCLLIFLAIIIVIVLA